MQTHRYLFAFRVISGGRDTGWLRNHNSDRLGMGGVEGDDSPRTVGRSLSRDIVVKTSGKGGKIDTYGGAAGVGFLICLVIDLSFLMAAISFVRLLG